MLTVGITGGIGSGKSTVCKIFGVLGIPVFQADTVARKLQNEDPHIRKRLTALFGSDIYSAEGTLDRVKLAKIIFNNRQLLEEVNQLVHPAVRREFAGWKASQHAVPYVLYEAAILFESGNAHQFDRTVLVVADVKERIARVMKRDEVTEEAILQRMQNQMKDSEKIKLADFILENNDNQMIIPQVLQLDQIFKSK